MTIERPEFQRLLFRTAFCVMACDGHIAEEEKKEIYLMNQSASYFQGIDLSDELQNLFYDLNARGTHIVDELFDTIEKLDISIVQELLLLEVSFRIVSADKKEDENEKKFLRLLRSKLKVHDEIIRDRFGVIEYLFDKDYSQEIVKEEIYQDLFATISIPEFKVLSLVDFSKFENDKN